MGLVEKSNRWGMGLAVAATGLVLSATACGAAPAVEGKQSPPKFSSTPTSEPLIVDYAAPQGMAGWRYRLTQY